jgi:hypothetical protein
LNYNTGSNNQLKYPIDDITNTDQWFEKEISDLPLDIRHIVKYTYDHLDKFCCWPKLPILLWEGCNRKPNEGEKQKYHCYPQVIKELAEEKQIYLDRRANGPAIASFEFAGGERHKRYGSKNKWSIHHIYSGKFPYQGRETTLHAKETGTHFTQSAGLIALHPILDSICDEIPAFSWVMRFRSWKKFGYDPDKVFSNNINIYGFDIDSKIKQKIIVKLAANDS